MSRMREIIEHLDQTKDLVWVTLPDGTKREAIGYGKTSSRPGQLLLVLAAAEGESDDLEITEDQIVRWETTSSEGGVG